MLFGLCFFRRLNAINKTNALTRHASSHFCLFILERHIETPSNGVTYILLALRAVDSEFLVVSTFFSFCAF